ncbi:MAG: membrane dipeptidase [Devosia sp.]
MDPLKLHNDAIVIDALQCSDFNRELFEEALRGGVTAINCSAVLWENFNGGIDYVTMWKRLIRDNQDLVRPIHSVADIHAAKREGKLGIIIGWQNTSPLEDRLDYIEIFKDLGVGIMQLTYNTQNYSGSGYLEPHDSGLSGFGQEVIAEMNRVGVLCDLSHVGEKTAADAIAYSVKPCAITHCLPRALKDVPRNKSDELFKLCAQKGGVIGTSLFAPGLAAGNDANVASVIDALEHTLDLVGEDHVAFGTDFSLNRPRPGPWLLWANKDKGTARKLTEFGSVTISKPEGIRRIDEFANLTREMTARNWSAGRIVKVLGGNWLRLLEDVWG